MNEGSGQESNKTRFRQPRNLGQIAMEVFSIVLGVLLALALSEWQETRNYQQRAGVALSNVRAELESNLRLLKVINPNNVRVVENITANGHDDPDDSTLIPGVQMRASAWQTLGATGLSNFVDYDVLIELSQLHAMIEVYRQTAYGFITSNMNMAAMATALDKTVENKRFSENFLAYFQMLVQIEAALIEAHEKAITTIDRSLDPH